MCYPLQALKVQRLAGLASSGGGAASRPKHGRAKEPGVRDLPIHPQMHVPCTRMPSWRRRKASKRAAELQAVQAAAEGLRNTEGVKAPQAAIEISPTFGQWGQSAEGNPSTASGPPQTFVRAEAVHASCSRLQSSGLNLAEGSIHSDSDNEAECSYLWKRAPRGLAGLHLLGKEPPVGWSCSPMEDWDFGSSDELPTVDTSTAMAATAPAPATSPALVLLSPLAAAANRIEPQMASAPPAGIAQPAHSHRLEDIAAAVHGRRGTAGTGRSETPSVPIVKVKPPSRQRVGYRTPVTVKFSSTSFMYCTHVCRRSGLPYKGEHPVLGNDCTTKTPFQSWHQKPFLCERIKLDE